MDSGNEVIIVDENIATNGLNGNHDESNEMKTRSKGADSLDEPVKSKLRSTRNANAKSDDKAGSDTEKKDKKMNLRSADPQDDKAGKSVATGDKLATKKNVTEDKDKGTPLKKKPEREDDSGINSRSSSVSNEETYSSRMRTRSKTAEALTSSTPASARKGASRMPLSTYDFDDDITFDDDASSSGLLKRKAVLYVEEMEEFDENEETNNEPPAKRAVYVPYHTYILQSLNPFTAICNQISERLSSKKIGNAENAVKEEDDAVSPTIVSKVSEDNTESENVDLTVENDVQSVEQGRLDTCSIM